MSTYLELTNMLLRALLDTELTQSNFATATSTQASAKDCIRKAVQEIYSEEPNWPFRYRTGSQVLTIGQEQYTLPTSTGNEVSAVDWNSFRIQKDDTLNINTTPLKLISHDEWKHFLRPSDEDSETDGTEAPKYVFLTSGSTASNFLSFGVSPSPDAAYTVLFDYTAIYPAFTLYSDETGIPERFDYVIINYALNFYYMFKDNTEQASVWESRARKSLSTMKRNLIPRQDSMRSTVINFGGYTRGSPFWDRI